MNFPFDKIDFLRYKCNNKTKTIMTQKQAIQLFEQRKVRTIWDEEHEKWYFSVVDVVGVLTDSVNPTDYFKKLRKRDSELSSFVGTNCPQISMIGHTGKRRMTLVADTEQLFRILPSEAGIFNW